MKELLIVFGLISAFTLLFSVLWFLWGIVILISGKMRFPKPNLDGTHARIASLFIILLLFLALLIHYGLHESYHWGRSGFEKSLQSSIGMSVIYSLYLILSFFSCRAYAKSKKNLEGEKDE